MESALRDDVFKDPDVFEVHTDPTSPLLHAADEAPTQGGHERSAAESPVELDKQRP
jgi:hypothetical protein